MTESQRWAQELAQAGKWLDRVLKGLAESQARRNPPRGARSIARAVWHLAEVDRHVIAMIDHKPVAFPFPGDEAKATPRTRVPALSALKSAAASGRRELIRRVRRLSPAGLRGRGYGRMNMEQTLRAVTWHGVYHAGQIALLRRLTGKPIKR